MNSRARQRGFSIIEMMVSLGIMSIVMLGAYQLFTEGMQLFRVNQATSDAQVAVTKAAGAISTELTNAAPALTRHYGPTHTHLYGGGGTPGGILPGITFATPLDKDGKVRYDSVNGQLYWQRYISYYFLADTNGGYDGKIYRGETDVAPEPGDPEPGNRQVSIIESFLVANNTNYFANNGAVKRRMIAEGISGLCVQPYDPSEDFGPGVTAAKTAYDVFIEAGDKAQSFRNSYFICVRVRVSPGAR